MRSILAWVRALPFIKTLGYCPKEARDRASIELGWAIGFAFIPLFIVACIVIFSAPLSAAPAMILSVLSKGELMVYATSIAGVGIYTIVHGIGPLPDAVRGRVDTKQRLGVAISLGFCVAASAYIVRRASEIHHFPLNVEVLNYASVAVILFVVMLTYVTLTLKYALEGGAGAATREQAIEFATEWERARDE